MLWWWNLSEECSWLWSSCLKYSDESYVGNRFVVSLLLILIFKKYTEHEFDGKKISRKNYTFWYLIFVLFFFSHTTRSWMFRHSDGNKNSWERKRLIKAFCPFATTATTQACIFLWKYQKIFVNKYVSSLKISSCGCMGVGHKILGFQRSSLGSHLPHPTARFVPCSAFVFPDTLSNIFGRNSFASLQLFAKSCYSSS